MPSYEYQTVVVDRISGDQHKVLNALFLRNRK
jgi:hypothetical protein